MTTPGYFAALAPVVNQAFRRASMQSLDNQGGSPPFFVESAEDVVLNELRWYRLGGEVSERQWGDILGVLRVQAGLLDTIYLEHWAARLGLADLLDTAMKE